VTEVIPLRKKRFDNNLLEVCLRKAGQEEGIMPGKLFGKTKALEQMTQSDDKVGTVPEIGVSLTSADQPLSEEEKPSSSKIRTMPEIGKSLARTVKKTLPGIRKSVEAAVMKAVPIGKQIGSAVTKLVPEVGNSVGTVVKLVPEVGKSIGATVVKTVPEVGKLVGATVEKTVSEVGKSTGRVIGKIRHLPVFGAALVLGSGILGIFGLRWLKNGSRSE
jgi:hypothetical protein